MKVLRHKALGGSAWRAHVFIDVDSERFVDLLCDSRASEGPFGPGFPFLRDENNR